jgi:hypothetical protein
VKDGSPFHVRLAGGNVTNDWNLIHVLRGRHVVTLIKEISLTFVDTVVMSADLLVLDCSEASELAMQAIPALKEKNPGLCVLPVDGASTEGRLPRLFRPE